MYIEYENIYVILRMNEKPKYSKGGPNAMCSMHTESTLLF